MGNKKKKKINLKPWCWYCDREFENEKILIDHQKAKHFKCTLCPRKLNTSNGMVVHAMQVHKQTIATVPGAVSGRDSVDIEIFGMDGIPEDDMQKHIEEVEKRTGQQVKRPRIEEQFVPAPSFPAAFQPAAPVFAHQPTAPTPLVPATMGSIPVAISAAPVVRAVLPTAPPAPSIVPVPTPVVAPVPTIVKTVEKPQVPVGTVVVYNPDQEISMEEQRAKLIQYVLSK